MNWESDSKVIIEAYYKCIDANNQKLFSTIDEHYEKARRIYPIVRFIDDRLSAVWLLTMEGKLWDADIIDRTVLETLIKLMFIVNAPDNEEQHKRYNEFWNDLWEINCLKHSEQSKKMIEHYKDNLSQYAHLPLILTEEEEKVLRLKWNRTDRKKLEQKWSFSEMLFSLTRNYKGQPFEMMIGLAHEYRMCSHVAHGDETGIGIIEERKSRSDKQRADVHIGHFLKLMSNCLAYASFLSITTMDFLNLPKDFFLKNTAKIEEHSGLISQYQNEVFNDPDYDKFKKK